MKTEMPMQTVGDLHWHDYFFRRWDLHARRRDAVVVFGGTSPPRRRDARGTSRYASLYQPRKVKSSSSCSSSFMRFKTAGEHSVAARSK